MDDYRKPDWWNAYERGEGDGFGKTPDPAMLRGEHAPDYIAGYAEGFLGRRAYTLSTPFYDLNGLSVQGRYPNSPPYPAIA